MPSGHRPLLADTLYDLHRSALCNALADFFVGNGWIPEDLCAAGLVIPKAAGKLSRHAERDVGMALGENVIRHIVDRLAVKVVLLQEPLQ